MEWLNYHHLYYFWVTAREGNLTRASELLSLAPSTVSAQVRALEDALGVELFHRRGRRLVLTDRGRQARAYCDEIFGLGRELVSQLVDPHPAGHVRHLRVGIADFMHKWLAHRILAKVVREAPGPVHLTCVSGHPDRLAADLALHTLDVLLTDTPAAYTGEPRADNVLLGAMPVVLLGVPALVEELTRGFPGSLDGAPALLPGSATALRRSVDRWFDAQGVQPRVVAEFEDSALMKAFGRDGAGVFPVPEAVAVEVCDVYGVQPLGALPGVTERVYLVRPRHSRHSLPDAMLDAARDALDHSS